MAECPEAKYNKAEGVFWQNFVWFGEYIGVHNIGYLFYSIDKYKWIRYI